MWKKIDYLKKRLKYNESEMPFLEHLEQLRKTIIYMGCSLLIGFIFCLPFGKNILGVLLKPAEPFIQSFPNQTNEIGIFLVFQEPTSSIKMILLVTLFGGIFISLPAMLYHLATFIFPGIKEKEQNAIKRIIFFSSSLFFLGIFMGYKITLPLAMEWMIKLGIFLGGESVWFYSKYIIFVLQIMLAFGLAFQLPVILIILGKMGFICSNQLRKKRRHVVVMLLIFSMLLTPPDVLTQLLLATPLILLYELCIWFLHFSGNRTLSSENDKN